MRVLLSGGGTSGHITPALAIADKIKKEDENAVIEYVGTEKGLETVLVPKAGYKIHYVKVQGIKRKLTLENLKALLYAVTSVIEAKKIIKEFRPDIVIGTGGYVCWPVLKAAANMGIATFVHESNVVPGLTTRMLAKYVDRILVNFRETKMASEIPTEKVVCVGNPVRAEMFTLKKDEMRKKLGFPENAKILLSYGGSLGAKRVNETVFEMISEKMISDEIIHIHATGNGYWEKAKEYFLERDFEPSDEDTLIKNNSTVKKYIYNMPELMACADVVICRAGAMTVSEIAAMGKAAIFIPSPNVTDNQQYENASVLERAGAAKLIEEKDLSPELLSKTVAELFEYPEKAQEMKEKIHPFAEEKCLDKIYEVAKQLTKK